MFAAFNLGLPTNACIMPALSLQAAVVVKTNTDLRSLRLGNMQYVTGWVPRMAISVTLRGLRSLFAGAMRCVGKPYQRAAHTTGPVSLKSRACYLLEWLVSVTLGTLGANALPLRFAGLSQYRLCGLHLCCTAWQQATRVAVLPEVLLECVLSVSLCKGVQTCAVGPVL